MRGRVVVVGSLNVDLALRTDRLPQPGETVLARSLSRSGGGKGANQAVGAARAGGAHTAMVGAVGADPDGNALLAGLVADGVDVSRVRRLPEHPTGTALITIDARAENTIVVAAGANEQLTIGDEDHALLSEADVVLAQLETPQAVVAAAARRRRAGVPFVLNAAPSAPLTPELTQLVDLLVVNEHEALDLSGAGDVESALRALLGSVPAVLVTLGAAGARLVSADGRDLAVTAPIVSAVDTVAAGDTFCGVFAAARAAGASELVALQRACAAASLAVQRAGAQDSIPTEAETLAQTSAVYG